MKLERESIWGVFENTESIESFSKYFFEDIYLSKLMPSNLYQQLEQVIKLLNFSYFEYTFLDLALLHSIIILEKAIKLKCEEANPNFNKKTNFKALCEWCCKHDMFEIKDQSFLEQLRLIRNGKVHDTKSINGGLVFIRKTKKVILLINDLYEDIELRKQRNSTKRDVCQFFNSQIHHGGILQINKNNIPIVKVDVVFVFNKLKTKEAWLLVHPIFNLNQNPENLSLSSRPYLIKVQNWKIKENNFVATNSLNELIQISPTRIETAKIHFIQWKANLNSLDFKVELMLNRLSIFDDYCFEAHKMSQKIKSENEL